MSVVIGQRQSQHQAVRSEDAFEIAHDGNRTAFAHQYWLAAETGLQRAQRSLCLRTGRRNQVGLRAVPGVNLHAYCGGTELLQMSTHELYDSLGILAGHP